MPPDCGTGEEAAVTGLESQPDRISGACWGKWRGFAVSEIKGKGEMRREEKSSG